MTSQTGVVTELGHGRIRFGGARTEPWFNRPGEADFLVDPGKNGGCPLANDNKVVNLLGISPEWKVLPAINSLYPDHWLITTRKCHQAGWLQRLGGEQAIHDALTTARLLMASESDALSGVELSMFAHVGPRAGQRFAHLPYHMVKFAHVAKPAVITSSYGSEIADLQGFTALASGFHAGEIILFEDKQPVFDEALITRLAKALTLVIGCCDRVFRSDQGRPPHFIVTIRISDDGKLRYVDYCPILNPGGSPELVTGPLEGAAFTLAWPHDATADLLKHEHEFA